MVCLTMTVRQQTFLTNDKNYLTQHQSLADYAKTVDVNTSLAKKANSADVYKKTEIDTKVTNINSSITAEQSRATTAENKIKTDLTTEINKKVATVTIEKDTTNDLQYHLIVDGEKTSDINIPKDQFLSNVVYSEATKVITFTFETTTGTTTTDVNVADLVDTYTAGDGLTLTDGKFSVKKDSTSQSYIEVSADGVKVVGIDEALALKANTTDVTTELNKKANSSDVYTTSQVDEKLNVKANVVDVYTKEQCNDNFMKIWQGSQSEYDAITSRDNNTLYVIE